jgi:hypothetical protein
MEKSDWFAVITGIIFLGAGSLMTAFGERVMKYGGATLIAIGIGGMIFWFGYYRNADAQQPNVSGNCNNFGLNNGMMNCGTLNLGVPQRKLDDSMFMPLKQQILGLSRDKSYEVVAVMGDTEAFQFAGDIFAFMKTHDFKVTGVDQSVFNKPVTGLLLSEKPNGTVDLIVGSIQH